MAKTFLDKAKELKPERGSEYIIASDCPYEYGLENEENHHCGDDCYDCWTRPAEPRPIFKCNGESVEISTDGGQTWGHVVDCCEGLGYTLERILSAINFDYEMRED